MNESYRLPMFPLGTPLLPGAVLPLQIFELRYQMLLDDCLAAVEPEFGVALIERGHEVGGGDRRSGFGTVARIVNVIDLADDRRGIVTHGTRRIRVEEWLVDDPYPRALVRDWPDVDDASSSGPEGVSAIGTTEVVALARAIVTLVGEPTADMMREVEPRDGETPSDHAFRLATLMPIGPADRQRVLGAPGPRARLHELARALDDTRAIVEFRLGKGSSS